jgi:hypothetical protein
MTDKFIEFDQIHHKGISIGFSFKVEVEWHYAEKGWCIERIYVAKEAVTSIEAGDKVGWVRIDDDADFQWIIPAINEHIADDMELADLGAAILWDRRERAA